MIDEENNLEYQDDFIKPEEDFLSSADFPLTDDDVFRKKPSTRKSGRKRKSADFGSVDEIKIEPELEAVTEEKEPKIEAEKEEPKEFLTEAIKEELEKESVEVKPIKFPELSKSIAGGGILTADMFDHIPVQVKVILGTAEISLKEVLELSENSIISLDKLVGEALDLVINDQVIAQGEVVVVDGNYGLKIKRIIKSK